MTEVKFVSMPASELAQVIEKACENAVTKVLAAQGDELLNITQLCERIPGLSYHSFKKLAKEHRFKDIKGRYSLTAVKAALQSH
ncbi:hypothetical protein MW722_001224 [Acinetobacter baumannii]|uniref:Excisionase n=5 Tax=Acinetobacter calcoaceticus/baumannii complex TaxID=909768 RepID=A0A0G3D3H3_ACIBA|nr:MULTISPECIES: hypothetical protein [Acinetobacter]EMT93991.1 hypothetical protein ABNIH5_01875 [Acinetobacter baumannii ABNIH5]ETY69629.1 hypothetical protein X964_04220 [Acinetobacter baumannii MDR_MMC4]EXB13460.1 hypothetical protein J513_1329 [Acinetobacter baumannii 1397084]EXC95076.1 hypothetical protein J484_1566 [Acinetobacter baumannii 1051830]EXD25313.1 hypothetical protein J480_1160 [Acinetobacter baumannii 34654]EYD12381.1 hypothetical protein J935_1008 [Acinetobacter baumannii 